MSASVPQSVLNWLPAGGTNSLSQTVQYKATTASTWTTFGIVAAGVSTATITGLVNNTMYDFQVLDNCSVGGPTSGTAAHGIQFACPSVTLTPTYNTVQFDFTLSALVDITKIDVQLLAADNVTILATQTILAPTAIAYSKIFTALTSSTTYYGRITQYAGASYTYTGVCTAQAVATAAAPACLAPTSISAVIS